MSANDMRMYSMRKNHIISLQCACGIMPSTSNQGRLIPSTARFTLQHWLRRRRYKNGLMKWRRRSISKRQNPIRPTSSLLSSSSRKKMEKGDWYKTTMGQISWQFKTIIPYLLYHQRLQQWRMPAYLQNLMYLRGTIIYVSEKRTNTKLHLKQNLEYMSLMSCSLG